MEKKLIPYSVYLPEEHVKKLRKLAKERKASELIRDSIVTMLDGNDQFKSGYNKGLKDAAKVVTSSPVAKMVMVHSRNLGVHIANQLKELEMK